LPFLLPVIAIMVAEAAVGTNAIGKLLDVMSRLRDPEHGCPWDLQQNFKSIVPFTVEETYELADAIEAENFEQIREELGDVLFQVVFYAQLASEQNRFDFDEVVAGITDKLVRRHPHVFSNNSETATSEAEVKENWERFKQSEREQKKQSAILDDVPRALPALSRAQKLQKRAARVGFDWLDADGVWAKIDEELSELRAAIVSQNDSHIEAELGDVLIAVVNLARHLGVDAESATRRANSRFENRFRVMEQAALEEGTSLKDETLEQLEKRWQQAKAHLAAD
jgi:ATP diphosphatase